ncbi:hypothetical protein T459_11623 [Capsicum annuum]|uniref:DUF1985 domain-containing protein n=1 Tax=Capsicum annuum TaxID=4072 RepID=A0A2G2ZMG0_CAPAN|nr:hypothetical protein T459_11623 [Capsicum annuum]
MDGETPFRRVTRGIEHVDKNNCGTPSFDLGVSQLYGDNACFIAELEEDKLRAETQMKSGNYHVKIQNSMRDCQSKDNSTSASKISMVNTSDSVFNISMPNRLMQTNFYGEEEPYNAILFQAFEDKVWGQNGDDALKISILYFIHHFIISDEIHTVLVLRIHFDVVEHEQNMDYCWGKEAFEELAKSISRKLTSNGQDY